jgi:hypothetical protein
MSCIILTTTKQADGSRMGQTERSFSFEVISENIETLTMIVKFESGSSFHHKQLAFIPDFQSLKEKISISGPSGLFGISDYWERYTTSACSIHLEAMAS